MNWEEFKQMLAVVKPYIREEIEKAVRRPSIIQREGWLAGRLKQISQEHNISQEFVNQYSECFIWNKAETVVIYHDLDTEDFGFCVDDKPLPENRKLVVVGFFSRTSATLAVKDLALTVDQGELLTEVITTALISVGGWGVDFSMFIRSGFTLIV